MDQARGKTGKPVANFEGDTCFRRGEGMSDNSLRIKIPQTIEDCLVCDLTGQPYVTRRDLPRRRSH